MIKLFDTHTHYDDEAFEDDVHEVITQMLSTSENGVAGFIAVGCNLERSLIATQLAEKYDNVFSSVGVHPSDCNSLPKNYLETICSCAKKNKNVSIGEIGLDYHYDGHDKYVQKRAFKEQLDLATELQLPAIIHSRDATKDTLDILKSVTQPKAVMHCFSGSAETALQLVQMGIMISFTGALAFKNAKKAVDAARAIPIEMIMLETDCPYMAPPPFRGKRCDSRMAWYTAQKLAEIKGMTTDEVVEICNNNAKRFFKIDF